MLSRRDRIIGILISAVALAVIPGAPSIAGESATHFTSGWSTLQSLPQALGSSGAATAACQGNVSSQCVYSLGGMSQSNNAYSTDNMLDSTTGSWHAVSHMKTGRSAFGVTRGPCPSNRATSCIYVVGGVNAGSVYLSSGEVYDPRLNSWSSIASLPTPGAPSSFRGRGQLAATSAPCFTNLHQTCVYAVGGYNPALYTLSSVEMYNPASRVWTAAAALTTARSRLAVTAGPCHASLKHTCIYAIGGAGTTGFLSSVEMFNPSLNRWMSVAGLHAPLSSSTSEKAAGMAAAEAPCQQTSRECVYAFGGQAANFTILGTAMRYDPRANAWTFVAPMATSRDNLAGSAGPCAGHRLHACLYALGGAGKTYTAAVESYTA